MSKIIKDALILFAITLVSGLALGFVYEITKAPIAAANEAATQEAYKAVFPVEGVSFTDHEGFDAAAATEIANTAANCDADVVNCVDAVDASGNLLGYVITMTSHAGYGGDITYSLGITVDGIINGYSITDISETAGLGMKAKEEKFSSQFNGRKAQIFEVTKTGATADNEIDAISAATITSKAMTYSIDGAVTYFEQSLKGGE